MRSTGIALAILVALTQALPAQRPSQFCAGFAEGWATVAGGAIVPICPIEPITPIGSTPFREGVKAGMRVAEQRGARRSTVQSQTAVRAGFCAGFAEGWKSVKGDLTIVPICPIEPITPIGSTPFREGLKAGIARARR